MSATNDYERERALDEALENGKESDVLRLTGAPDFDEAHRRIQSYEATPVESSYVEWDGGWGYDRYDIEFAYSEPVRRAAVRFCASKGRVDLLVSTGQDGYTGESCPPIRLAVLDALGDLARKGNENAWQALLRLYNLAKAAAQNTKARWDLDPVARILIASGRMDLPDTPVPGKYLVEIIRDPYGRGENLRRYWKVSDHEPENAEETDEQHCEIVTYLSHPYTKRQAFLLGLE